MSLWRGIQGRLLLIVALSTLAMALAGVAAIRALDQIGEAAETVTGRDVPAMAAALRLARIGDRLQSRGASLMAASTAEALSEAQRAIDADLAAFAEQMRALRAAAPGENSDQIATLSADLAARLRALSADLDRLRAVATLRAAERAKMLAQQDFLRQLLGPSILAVEAITAGETLPDPEIYRTAVRSQAPLLAAERLTDRAMSELLLAGDARDAPALQAGRAAYRRTLAQLDATGAALPAGLRAEFRRALVAFHNQAKTGGIFDLQAEDMAARARAEADLRGAAARAADLKTAVDGRVIAASTTTAEVTESLRRTILERTAQFAAIGLAVILIAGGLSYGLVIRPLARNLRGVTAAMVRLAAGERDATVPGASRADEIGDLARAFSVFRENSAQVEKLDRELAERSSLLLATFETMKDGFSVFDRDRRLVACNPQYLTLHDFTAAEVATAPTITEINRMLTARGVQASLPDGTPVDLDDLVPRRLAGPTRIEMRFPAGRVLELRSNPIPMGGFATIHMDVTESRATQSQLLHAQKLETVGQLTGGIAHDFNNILAVIIGNLNILARELGPSPALKARAERGLSAANRAAGLINRLLTFSRRQRLAPENVDLNGLVHGMLDLLQSSLGSGVRITPDLAADLPRVRVDPGQLENALMNLAVNARDAMEGAGEITVTTRRAADGFVELAVSDTGAGIPPDLLDQVFEPFFTTKPVGKGSGLGLSMVYGFVRQSGGTVTIDSAPGAGTRVSLRLLESPAPEAPARPEGLDTAEACILAVDDDADLLEITADQLRRLGHAVVTAPDGLSALEMLQEIPEIDLLYTDLAMPGLDGRALAEKAQALRPDLPVLFTSGAPGKAGADLPNLLRKPVPEEVLAAAIRLTLEDQSRRTSASST
ncbi:PAS-domain containing protein [Rhodobacter capsulatus]|uniref:ATP-binding protein n=1 Tax=Rhodobacter capsulatus TaxID=1061 RepID=UPI0006DCA9FB|nr:ATP-binding protein [Rhodobacter capsulatus]KQB12457.1 histidine kinase [Rhodobacter capsulatus]KQB15975.1 histidine kinase [Rhodobacter capsulatus]PZX26575.1 HAMP domain-containing protein [Rhodobacter capsulatus]QNR62051.1 PAS-domain containing protein [Rhodobacter capsulatus]